MAKTFDSKCYDLASAFLEDEPNLFTDDGCKELAARIQQTIEDFIEEARCELTPFAASDGDPIRDASGRVIAYRDDAGNTGWVIP